VRLVAVTGVRYRVSRTDFPQKYEGSLDATMSSHNVNMVAHVRAGPGYTRQGTIIDWNPVDKMYSIALDVGITVRAWPRDVTVTNVQDVDPPVLFDPRRPVFVAGLQQIMAEPEMEEQEDVEEIPVGELVMYIPVVYGVAV
jgi:hypothetical protein